MSRLMSIGSAIAAGLLFGAGLVVSGMASPENVLGFLELDSDWNPSLGFVMAGALAVTVPGFALMQRRGKPFLASGFAAANRSGIDYRLLGGAALFGIGWGLSGYCPGPALVGAGVGNADALVLLAGMLLGARVVRDVSGPGRR